MNLISDRLHLYADITQYFPSLVMEAAITLKPFPRYEHGVVCEAKGNISDQL